MELAGYKAVILAGGRGSRLYPVTKEIPKPLLPVKGKPIINYLVDLFSGSGIKDIAVLIGQSQKEDFEWWKKRYYSGLNIRFKEEAEPLGTFGGLALLKDWIGASSFFMANGDNLIKMNLPEIAEFHKKNGFPATIALVEVEDACSYGSVVCKSGVVMDFLEKSENPPTNYINAGLYLFSPEIFKYHPGAKFSMVEKDLFPKLAKDRKLAGFQSSGDIWDCGTWERYGKALEA